MLQSFAASGAFLVEEFFMPRFSEKTSSMEIIFQQYGIYCSPVNFKTAKIPA